MKPIVDLVILGRQAGPLHPEVEHGLCNQTGVELVVHRVVGKPSPQDRCRWDTIARARNKGKLCGNAPWLMYLDDDVMLGPNCISTLVSELSRSPVYGALAADYLGEKHSNRIAGHVAMGATLFRREALEKVCFTWREKKCECQCCCDDLRRSHWGIDYCSAAKAMHLPHGEICKHGMSGEAEQDKPKRVNRLRDDKPGPPYVPSVCLIVCYLGPYPPWINHFLLSCAYNPTIDFLLFTDQEHYPAAPPNVHFKRITSSSFNKIATDKIGIKINLSHSRKLCDFKPTYGHLFEELLEGWDYWGYTDLDVIYGDLQNYLSSAKLQDYDIFTARKEFLVGHFTLFRNNNRMRMLYRQSADFRETLTARQVLSFDECGKQWLQRLRKQPTTHPAKCDSMTHIVQRMMAKSMLSARFFPGVLEWPELNEQAWSLKWHAGKLRHIDQCHEAMYFHFHAFKDRRGYREPHRVSNEQGFEMTSSGIRDPNARSKLSICSDLANCEVCDSLPYTRTWNRSTVAYSASNLF